MNKPCRPNSYACVNAFFATFLVSLVLALLPARTLAQQENETAAALATGLQEFERGQAALKGNRFKVARQELLAARNLFRQNDDTAHELETLMLLGQLETAVKNHRLATHYLAQARALLERAPGAEGAQAALPPPAEVEPVGEPALANTSPGADETIAPAGIQAAPPATPGDTPDAAAGPTSTTGRQAASRINTQVASDASPPPSIDAAALDSEAASLDQAPTPAGAFDSPTQAVGDKEITPAQAQSNRTAAAQTSQEVAAASPTTQ